MELVDMKSESLVAEGVRECVCVHLNGTYT